MKLHVNMCIKLEKHKDSKKKINKNATIPKDIEKNILKKYFSFDILGFIRTF
jgi:hypothetical protein